MRKQINSICENLKNTKNTCTLFSFQEVIEKCLEEKKILNRDSIIESLESLSNLIPSK